MTRHAVQQMISKYGKLAKMTKVRVSPHTFRHTFAKMWILNGGDAFSLQKILGHTTMDMVRNYVNLASSDVQIQHRKFSPLDRMGL
jgi:integrase/recombinase XerD